MCLGNIGWHIRLSLYCRLERLHVDTVLAYSSGCLDRSGGSGVSVYIKGSFGLLPLRFDDRGLFL
jgi:hypothetical protein